MIAPEADTIAELFATDPVLVVLDEMGEYLRRVQHMGGRDQLTAFLKALFTAAEGNPHATVVFTLAISPDGKGVGAFAEENEFLASAIAELESVSGRKATNLGGVELVTTADPANLRILTECVVDREGEVPWDTEDIADPDIAKAREDVLNYGRCHAGLLGKGEVAACIQKADALASGSA